MGLVPIFMVYQHGGRPWRIRSCYKRLVLPSGWIAGEEDESEKMVTLSKIYTKTGDGGRTRLGDMTEVAKTNLRIGAYGCVDELNSTIGLARVHGAGPDDLLGRVQNDLFDVGADLCVPLPDGEVADERLRLQVGQVEYLEQQIDRFNTELQPLRSFVLPGGTAAAAWLHMARAIARRAEREVWRLAECERVGEPVLHYLNRVSDLFFVLARLANDAGGKDVLWIPGDGARND